MEVEVESASALFHIASDSVIASAGALKSPHVLLLSRIGLKDQLEEFSLPVVNDLPKVGSQLWNHPQSSLSFSVKDDVQVASNAGALGFGLQVTSEPPSQSNGVMFQNLSGCNVVTQEVLPDGTARISCTLELLDRGHMAQTRVLCPLFQLTFNYCYFHHNNDIRRMRDALRLVASILDLTLLECHGRTHVSHRRRAGQ